MSAGWLVLPFVEMWMSEGEIIFGDKRSKTLEDIPNLRSY